MKTTAVNLSPTPTMPRNGNGTSSAWPKPRSNGLLPSMNDDMLPDALASVLGRVVADAKQAFQKHIELQSAEQRATLAEYRAEILELRHENAELRRTLKET